MTGWPDTSLGPAPVIYEVNTAVWLAELSVSPHPGAILPLAGVVQNSAP